MGIHHTHLIVPRWHYNPFFDTEISKEFHFESLDIETNVTSVLIVISRVILGTTETFKRVHVVWNKNIDREDTHWRQWLCFQNQADFSYETFLFRSGNCSWEPWDFNYWIFWVINPEKIRRFRMTVQVETRKKFKSKSDSTDSGGKKLKIG